MASPSAVPELLDQLALENSIVTLDAMGCQTAVAERILARGADYLLVLKASHQRAHEAIEAAKAARTTKAQTRAADLAPIISELQAQGITSRYGIAKALNEQGIPAARGGKWTTTQVRRLLARL